ncbi:MAG TPA: hypothetical protein DCL71_03895 [Bifidobacterium sp.]|nr:hypothetical protein [Bifidobacterium sp.]
MVAIARFQAFLMVLLQSSCRSAPRTGCVHPMPMAAMVLEKKGRKTKPCTAIGVGRFALGAASFPRQGLVFSD